MSVIMSLRVPIDPDRFEQVVREAPERLEAIIAKARQAGAIHHQFCAGDGEVIVVDEWPDEASFRAFFEESAADIVPMFAEAGMEARPEPEIWRVLDTPDRI